MFSVPSNKIIQQDTNPDNLMDCPIDEFIDRIKLYLINKSIGCMVSTQLLNSLASEANALIQQRVAYDPFAIKELEKWIGNFYVEYDTHTRKIVFYRVLRYTLPIKNKEGVEVETDCSALEDATAFCIDISTLKL